MKIFKDLLIILALSFVGEILSYFLPFPLPGSIIGFLLLFFLLLTGLLGEKPLDHTGKFFLNHLQFFFIPATVSLITVISIVGGAIGQILIICLISTIVTFIVTVYTVKAVMWMQEKAKRGKV